MSSVKPGIAYAETGGTSPPASCWGPITHLSPPIKDSAMPIVPVLGIVGWLLALPLIVVILIVVLIVKIL